MIRNRSHSDINFQKKPSPNRRQTPKFTEAPVKFDTLICKFYLSIEHFIR